MTLDLSKPVRTKDGKSVEILRSNINNPDYPVVGIVTDGSHQHIETYTADGFVIRNDSQSLSNLENVPVYEYKIVYKDGDVRPDGRSWKSDKDLAGTAYQTFDRLGYIKRLKGDAMTTVFEPV